MVPFIVFFAMQIIVGFLGIFIAYYGYVNLEKLDSMSNSYNKVSMSAVDKLVND